MRRVMALAVPAVAIASVLGACGGSDAGGGDHTSSSDDHKGSHGSREPAGFAASDADAVVTTELVSYGFTGIPESVKGPRVFFVASNREGTDHELIVRKGDEELYELEAFKKGSKTLAVELEPGQYELVCLIDEGAKTHEELGMRAALTVTE